MGIKSLFFTAVRVDSYDFKGHVPEKIRQVISDTEILSVFSGPPPSWAVPTYRVNWQDTGVPATDDPVNAAKLNATEFTTTMEYDALGRVTKMTYPEDVDSQRKILLPSYNRAGHLVSVDMKDTAIATAVNYVERIAYNARGQKILVAFGNGVMTRYRYDDITFRLSRMKTEKYVIASSSEAISYVPNGSILQNLAYTYDLSGNIISINDKTTDCGYGGTPDEITRAFSYDPLYRLLSATGRETAGTAAEPWDDTYRPQNRSLARAYTQNYAYDKLGNISSLQHTATGGNFTRNFNYVTNKNKLNTIVIGSDTHTFVHDANGNIISDDNSGSRFFEFDYADRLRSFRIQAGTSEPSQFAHYLYDGGGNRVKKIVRKQGGGYNSTTYIDSIFEYTKTSSFADRIDTDPKIEIGKWIIGADNDGEQNTLHIMDDSARIATRRIGADLGDTKPAIKYNIDDHLGSSSIQLDNTGTLISWEEYYPFGETSFGGYTKKKYRFCGKEKDEESGLYYYGMRYYSPWTCRFVSVDPLAGKYPFYTPYQYAGNKPINASDLDGAEEQPKTDTGGQANGVQKAANSAGESLSNKGNDETNNIATGTYIQKDTGETHTYTEKDKVFERSLKDFGWEKKTDLHGTGKAQEESKNGEAAKGTIKHGSKYAGKGLDKLATKKVEGMKEKGILGSSNGKNYQSPGKTKAGDWKQMGNKSYRTAGHDPTSFGTRTMKLASKGLKQVGNFVKLYELAQIRLGKAEPYTFIPLSFLAEEHMKEADETLINVAIGQGYEATLSYVTNCRTCKEFQMIYMNEQDFKDVMEGKTTSIDKIKSYGDKSQGYSVLIQVTDGGFFARAGFFFK
ncbi:MAG TPA: RHS repeat-associated core domain-containing protein [Cytophagaceae bacterium]|jgi:RHS repeat-associated protein|nr:RHS repeat-associated core domain-containing protein [Cytophagaceae bacterium]